MPRLLHGIAIVLGAFLLFQIQPMVAKAILPWFGGSAAVWTTCLVFFQGGLLLGYLYAHGLIRFAGPRGQAWIHLALLAASVALLPINPSAAWKPHGAEEPTLRILGLLAVSVGLPYVVLSATSPLLQAWDARSHPEGLPWTLFALSNAGSLAALLGYPLAIEPLFGVRFQMHAWSAVFAVFAVLCGAVAWRSASSAATVSPRAEEPFPPRGDVALWILLSACGTVALMAVTTHLSQNVAAPLLWVLPLSLYLVTFIVCLGSRPLYRRGAFVPGLFLAVWAMALLLGPVTEAATLLLVLPVFAAGLFAVCMVCHGELARLRPGPAHLTAFYLCISAGGALGGMFAGVVAPRIFSREWELPIALGAAVLVPLAAIRRRPPARLGKGLFGPVWGSALLAGVLTAIGLLVQAGGTRKGDVVFARDFYGCVRVTDDAKTGLRSMRHGIIVHGEQGLDEARRREPAAYFAPWSGAGLALGRAPSPKKVGVIGLGTGTLAAYGKAGDEFRFYEISPLVIDLARAHFSYLSDTPAKVELIPGDGRLSLEAEASQQFDVLLVDAFSGDAIPVHLLTREAFALYRRHLKPGGTLVVQVTNRYLDIAPVVANAAARLGLKAFRVQAIPDDAKLRRASTWVLVGDDVDRVEPPKGLSVGDLLAPDPSRPEWTDDASDLLRVVRR